MLVGVFRAAAMVRCVAAVFNGECGSQTDACMLICMLCSPLKFDMINENCYQYSYYKSMRVGELFSVVGHLLVRIDILFFPIKSPINHQ